jgi:hypothetical protein
MEIYKYTPSLITTLNNHVYFTQSLVFISLITWMSHDAALLRVKRVLLDMDAMPYVPELFSARNPPKPVSTRLLFVGNNLCDTITD